MKKKNNKIIYHTPDDILDILNRAIDLRVQNIPCYCYNPVSDFTRTRFFDAHTLIDFILGLTNFSSTSEISRYFALHKDKFIERKKNRKNKNDENGDVDFTPSPSALSQARRKLMPEIFKAVNHTFISSFDNLSTFRGYHLLAQDGSDMNIPYLDDDTKKQYGDNKPFCQYHINALYDCINNIYYDYSIDSCNKKQECMALIKLMYARNYPLNSIIIADRGYENYNLIAHFIENGQKFIIRAKDITSCNGIVSTLNLPDESFDVTVHRTLTNFQTKEVKANADGRYVFVPSTSTFDFLDANTRKYDLSFRVVRFEIGENQYETLITNLDDEFRLEDFKEIYHRRWAIETSFRYLKYNIGTIYFHSKNRQLVQQEIHAAMLLYNFCSTVVENIDIEEECKNKKHEMKVSVALAITEARLFMKGLKTAGEIIVTIKKNLVPVRPDRKYKRPMRPKTAKSMNHRTS